MKQRKLDLIHAESCAAGKRVLQNLIRVCAIFFVRTSVRLRGVASGARKVKNRYGSSLETLSHVQLWYVERETRDLVRIQQCDLLESFNKAQSDYGLSTGLAMVSEIAERVLPE